MVTQSTHRQGQSTIFTLCACEMSVVFSCIRVEMCGQTGVIADLQDQLLNG